MPIFPLVSTTPPSSRWCYRILSNGKENDRITIYKGMVLHLFTKYELFPASSRGKVPEKQRSDGKCLINGFPNKETQVCRVCPNLWCKPSHHALSGWGLGRDTQPTSFGQLIGGRASEAQREVTFHRVFLSVYLFPKPHSTLYLCLHTRKHTHTSKGQKAILRPNIKSQEGRETFLKCSIIFCCCCSSKLSPFSPHHSPPMLPILASHRQIYPL